MNYLARPNSKSMPSRRNRKTERNKVFLVNYKLKRKQKTERRRMRHE